MPSPSPALPSLSNPELKALWLWSWPPALYLVFIMDFSGILPLALFHKWRLGSSLTDKACLSNCWDGIHWLSPGSLPPGVDSHQSIKPYLVVSFGEILCFHYYSYSAGMNTAQHSVGLVYYGGNFFLYWEVKTTWTCVCSFPGDFTLQGAARSVTASQGSSGSIMPSAYSKQKINTTNKTLLPKTLPLELVHFPLNFCL